MLDWAASTGPENLFMNALRHLLFACLPLLGAAQCAVAAERLAVGARFDLIFDQGADGQWQGLSVDVLRTLAARAGDTVRFGIYPWARAQAMVQRAQADILIGPYKSPERDKLFDFVDLPFYRDRLVFYARSGDNPPWRGEFGPLAATRIAAVRGWHYGARFDQARPRLDISEVNQLENGVQMLMHGRVDLLATNERNSAARDQYNALFTEMVRSGEFARLAARHGVLAPTGVAGGTAAAYNKPCPTGPSNPL